MSSFFSQKQINHIAELAKQAGAIAAKAFQEKSFNVERKIDGSKVTSADIEVSEFLRKKLAQEFPEIPVICEEGKLREAGDIFFLIDPIDGTSSFVSGNVEFSINIALVKNKKPIFGLIYSPLFELEKMIFCDENNLLRGCKKSATNANSKTLRIITSPRSKDQDIRNFVEKFCPDFLHNFSVEKLSSAIKFFRILEGDADLYLHFRPSMEWDTAAGQAMIELLGGKVKTLNFNSNEMSLEAELAYGKPGFENKPFVTSLRENFSSSW